MSATGIMFSLSTCALKVQIR